jgi:hypothetical protein
VSKPANFITLASRLHRVGEFTSSIYPRAVRKASTEVMLAILETMSAPAIHSQTESRLEGEGE